MTSMPADRLRLPIAADCRRHDADLVLLNPSPWSIRSTFSDPTALPIGIEKVFVAGELVWDSGKPVAMSPRRPGRVIATPN